MTMIKMMATLLIGSGAVMLQACTSNSATENKISEAKIETVTNAETKVQAVTNDTHIKQYAKPGAAISFSNNYDGHTGVGEVEDIQIIVHEQYGSGTLDISISTDDGLVLNSGTSQVSFSMGGEPDKTIDLSVSAQAAGKYYINLQALADAGDGQIMPRVQAIAIYVGNEADYKKPKNNLKLEESGSGKVIVMDAEEIIKEGK